LSALAIILFAVVAVPLCVLGAHRVTLAVKRLWMGRVPLPEEPPPLPPQPPWVTIQLPLFNERLVARRIIEAAAAIRYPRDRFEIQVLDDSTDDTVDLSRAVVAELRATGVAIELLHREDRSGFKAGALAHGLETARGELVAVFDADFLPPPDFLEVVVPAFDDQRLGMVQARWEHLNRRHSLLTVLQALLLDGHFLMESAVRHRFGAFFNFNGTAGVWRRQAIDEAGGWQGDTLTEDLDLSYRAQLAGWRFRFLEAFTVPAELPERIRSFRSQQHRWTKGSIQVGVKLLPALLRARLSPRIKVEALFHLFSNLAFPLVLVLTALIPPMLLVRQSMTLEASLVWWGVDLPMLGLATVPVAAFYVITEYARRALRPATVVGVPLAMALGVGMAVNNTRAVMEGLLGHQSPFVRTPKVGEGAPLARRYRSPWTGAGWIELGIAAYYVAAVVWAATHGAWGSIPFLCLFLMGFGYVGAVTAFEPRS
jgi:cellulose synthase/poly-beta-1,6-N-acetylglucosamine synthase-like glycosyltransferase